MRNKYSPEAEHILFWCPALPNEKKPKPLTHWWKIFDGNLSTNACASLAKQCQRKLSNLELERSEFLLKQWQNWHVSRYNTYPVSNSVPKNYILLVLGSEGIDQRHKMLRYAAELSWQSATKPQILIISSNENPVPTSEEMAAINALTVNVEITYLSVPCHHAPLLKNASHVVVFNDWLGFEALLWQKDVSVFGKPFYANIGLTQDLATNEFFGQTSLAQLVYYVLFEHSYSYCYEQNKEIVITEALSWLNFQVSQRSRFPATLYAIGFNFFWQKSVRDFFQGSRLIFVKNATQVPAGSTAIIWGNKKITPSPEALNLIQLEDGFLRSVGLGALFARPLSWVADNTGMYFDATSSSDLELILNQANFATEELDEADQLIQLLCQNNITKYNTGQGNWRKPVTSKRLLLVPGQVESDASIAYGAADIQKNIDLVKAVRANNPDAYIIYKPHPDVLAGARASGTDEQLAQQYVDLVVNNVDISEMLNQVDEVHVLTSLAGFEALLRGKTVVCYGKPFYAGWGLTQDQAVLPRRTAKLSLQELVAGVLLRYPMYVSYNTGFYTSAVSTAETLFKLRSAKTTENTIWQKVLRQLVNIIRDKK